MRIRLFYEKRGFACFVPHVALSTVFTRAVRRAGVELESTEGFARRAKISFGPELPAGVVALNEPVDLWLKNAMEDNQCGFFSSLPEVFNAQMPEGFRVTKCVLPAEGALGKECRAAHYLLWSRNGLSVPELLAHLKRYYGEAVLSGSAEAGEFPRASLVLADPAQNGIGGWIKALTADGAVSGWQDMCVVRTGLGRWNGERMELMHDA